MRKISMVLGLGILSVILIGCMDSSQVRLPDLEGMVESEIRLELEALGLEVNIMVRQAVEGERSNEFVEYGQFLQAGDRVDKESLITVIVSKTLYDESDYFSVKPLEYEGPRLDESFFEFEWFEETSSGIIGTGGVFDVTYSHGRWTQNRSGGCIDGDTTVFTYPEEVYAVITSNTPSTRYFNLDTPETFPGGEEPFGQEATQYVCQVLSEAEGIKLQTDPGDFAVGNYGRLLAWVWVLMPGQTDYELLNYNIVRQGLGTVAYLYGAGETEVTVYEGLTYTEWMFDAMEKAINDSLGLHGDQLDYYWDYEADAPHPTRWP